MYIVLDLFHASPESDKHADFHPESFDSEPSLLWIHVLPLLIVWVGFGPHQGLDILIYNLLVGLRDLVLFFDFLLIDSYGFDHVGR